MLVSVIVPVYKKEKTVKKHLENIHTALVKSRWDFELIAVVDGFLDRSYERANKIEKPNLRVYGYQNNRGKGYAVRYGMARANGDYIAFIDDSGRISPNGLSMVLEHMEWYDVDIIVGSKRYLASKVKYTRIRKIYSWVYYRLVRLLFGLRLTDTQTGLKVYKRKVLDVVLPRLVVKRYAFDIELLAVAHYLGFSKIYDAPVECTVNFSNSGFLRNKPMLLDPEIRGMLYDTIAVFYRLRVLKYYHNSNKRKWVHDKELQMRVNTGESK